MYFFDVVDGFSCGGAGVLRVIKFIFMLLDVVFLVVPIGLILMISVDLVKNVIAKDDGEMKKSLNLGIKRIIFCVVLFLVEIIVSFAIGLLGNLGVPFLKCIDIARTHDLSKYEVLFPEEDYSNVGNSNLGSNSGYDVTGSNGSSSQVGTCGGTYKGTKYNLTDAQLNALANACEGEQGSVAGAAAEASLIANQFELYSLAEQYGSGGEGLLNYIRQSTWFASDTKEKTYKTESANEEIKKAVKDVLVNGNRTLPLYIDEHDDLSDIEIVTNNGSSIDKNDRAAYKKDVTVIDNSLDSVYTFYCFPAEGSDPFGYTADAKQKYDANN